MIFKSAQASMPIYLFDRNALTLTTGKVTSFVPSHIDMKYPGKMVIDITCLIDSKSQTYTIDDSLTVAYFGSTTISLDLDSILREIETLRNSSEQALSEVEHHKQLVTRCDQLLLDHNPKLKERQALESRFSSIDSKFSTLDSKLDKLSSLLESFTK